MSSAESRVGAAAVTSTVIVFSSVFVLSSSSSSSSGSIVTLIDCTASSNTWPKLTFSFDVTSMLTSVVSDSVAWSEIVSSGWMLRILTSIGLFSCDSSSSCCTGGAVYLLGLPGPRFASGSGAALFFGPFIKSTIERSGKLDMVTKKYLGASLSCVLILGCLMLQTPLLEAQLLVPYYTVEWGRSIHSPHHSACWQPYALEMICYSFFFAGFINTKL